MTLDRAANASLLEDFTSSYSMRGITVELTVVVRRAALVRTVTTALASDAALPAALLRVRPLSRQTANQRRPYPYQLNHCAFCAMLSRGSWSATPSCTHWAEVMAAASVVHSGALVPVMSRTVY